MCWAPSRGAPPSCVAGTTSDADTVQHIRQCTRPILRRCGIDERERTPDAPRRAVGLLAVADHQCPTRVDAECIDGMTKNLRLRFDEAELEGQDELVHVLRGADRFEAKERKAKWLEYDQRFFRRLYRTLSLAKYLGPGLTVETLFNTTAVSGYGVQQDGSMTLPYTELAWPGSSTPDFCSTCR